MIFLATIIITLLISEALTQRKLMKTFRTNRYYVFKYLAVNKENKTLESYLLKQFFPKYIMTLGIGFVLAYVGHFLMSPADPIICGLITLGVVLLRIYNRNIFTSLWNELGRIQ
jgi:hypothetical protein